MPILSKVLVTLKFQFIISFHQGCSFAETDENSNRGYIVHRADDQDSGEIILQRFYNFLFTLLSVWAVRNII